MVAKSSLFSGFLIALASLCGTLAAPSTSPGCTQPAKIVSGTFSVTVNGTERQYIVRVPEGYNHEKPSRVVVGFHWYGGSMQDVELDSTKYGNGSYFGLKALGGDSTIFVAPQGIANGWMNTNGDDLAFLDTIVETIDNGLCVDTNQRFAVGFSFGGSMAYAVANSRGKTFRAVAILSGTIFTPWTDETVPISLYVQHGVSDPANPITQGRTMRDHFVEVNGCANQTVEEPVVGSASHIKTEFKDCLSGKVVTFVAFDGVHQYSPLDADSQTPWSPEEIWNFFLNAP
ncbi:hypothetical protein Poli38472_002247 [Pythium oligandrum]|uniref:Feruloyl esterase n=1 Tax=Pythium oligandrum TaxID=41045 RepID=A0A8K1CGV9_PYTOL|nr:hypothetical protein Poli38472_002247 [Pythium oligandrum]|eukprot:TMW63306.1 hypothetical protein Poli38472_002247 [Pythium oligandrum]